MRGLFLTFEGLDGSGKTTQLRLLAGWLQRAGIDTVTLRQPGGTPLGDRLRSVLLDTRATDAIGALSHHAEMALMFADRAQAIHQVIEPSLAAGKIVLCDRFTDSTEAYQGGGRQLGSSAVLDLHRVLCNNLQPDLTLLLQPDFGASLNRARRRNERQRDRTGSDENRFETEDDRFYSRIAAAYRAIATREPHRVAIVPGDDTIEQIEQQIRIVVLQRLPALRQRVAAATVEARP